ncbi:hypothetical protein Ahy_A09g045381 [Arachis hypogaea]|uniref:Uncharacterized protein n=1 Tax=Arachis hypogaea TaxID=3818 RepID=A0A445BM98_ARAHY|nr:hypothetical protein Ahy_A09g045381 [Arachis hypogaea]
MAMDDSFLVLVHYKGAIKKKMRKLGQHGMKRIEKLYYRISISVVRDGVNNEDLQVLFHYRCQFSEVRIPELLAKLVDVVSS